MSTEEEVIGCDKCGSETPRDEWPGWCPECEGSMSNESPFFDELNQHPEATEIDHGSLPQGHANYDSRNPENNRIPSPTNLDRAEWVRESLDVFAERCGMKDTGEDADTVISDFLGDLMHLCRMNRLDFDALVERGRRHHDVEKEGAY